MKRLLILLLTCCVVVLSGCGGDDGYTVIEIDQEEMLREFLEEKGITWEEYQQQLKEQEEAAQRPPEEVEEPPAIEESVIPPGIQIENDNLKKNFELVCDQVGIDTDKITEMQPAGEWNGGPAYSFMYEDLLLVMMCNTDNTVARIAVNGNIQVFLQNDSAYNISEFIVDQDVMVQVESIAEKLLRDELKLKDTEELPLTDWQPTRNSNVYNVIGGIVLQDDDQGTYFVVGVEVSKDVKEPTLRYFSIGDKVYKDEFDKVKNPEAMVSVEQEADVLYNGDNGFLLSWGEVGQYGEVQEDPVNGETYLYAIPAGKYTVTSKTPLCALWITAYNGKLTDEIMADEDQVRMIDIGAVDDKREVTIADGERIVLSFGSKAVFEPIQ